MPVSYWFEKVVFNWVRVFNFWEGQVEKIELKWEKDPISLGLKKKFLQFVPEKLEHILYTFLMTNLSLLSQNLKKKMYF